MDADLQRCREVAEDAARRAGAQIVRLFHRGVEVRLKGRFDVVTEADFAAQRIIVETLRSAFPDHGYLGEEGLEEPGRVPWRWVIDPLDGTTNFVHGYPHFCVSIGLEVEGTTAVGVVYDPLRDELFDAVRGAGSRREGAPCAVSEVEQLEHALLFTGFPAARGAIREALGPLERVLDRTRAVRRDGSAVLDLCYVACGRSDGFFELGLHPWDTCAGMLLVTEAGGQATGRDGAPPAPRELLVATNGRLHAQVLSALAS